MDDLLRDISTCVRCGYCQAYCPTYRATRNEGYNARGRLQLAQNAITSEEYSEVFSKRVSQCLLCGSCSEHCPPGIDVHGVIETLREDIIEQNGLTETAARLKSNVGEIGNITGDDQANRLLWLQSDTQVKLNEKAEVLYLTGCVPSLYPSAYSIPQSFVRILNIAGVDFTLMGEKEICCGYPLAIGGLPHEAEKAAEKNIEAAKELGVSAVVTTCPSCYHTWKEYYPEMLGYTPEIDVVHATEFLLKLVQEGKLSLSGPSETVTYHDPCDLGRKSGIYDAPRELISACGASLVEMRYSRGDAMCCGGGGNLESSDAVLSSKVSQERVRQALDTGAGMIVSSCQQCKRTLQGGARSLKARIKVMDVIEMVLKACEQEE